MRNKKIRYITSVKFDNFISGTIWLMVGILGFFTENLVCNILHSIFLLLCIIRCTITMFTIKNIETCDEMASKNINYARSMGYITTLALILICVLIVLILKLIGSGYELLFYDVFPFFFAIPQFVIGIIFVKSEKDGEEWLD